MLRRYKRLLHGMTAKSELSRSRALGNYGPKRPESDQKIFGSVTPWRQDPPSFLQLHGLGARITGNITQLNRIHRAGLERL